MMEIDREGEEEIEKARPREIKVFHSHVYVEN